MAYITRDFLRDYGTRDDVLRKAILVERAGITKTAATSRLFCSHSHEDKELVEHVSRLLKTQGVSLYVDWQDVSMPKETTPETARLLQGKIRECGRVLLLASRNAQRSVWVPWELGWADGELGDDKIAVLPVGDMRNSIDGIEFIGLYSTVEIANNGAPAVFPPGQSKGRTLANWLRG